MTQKKTILIGIGIIVLLIATATFVRQKGIYTFWGSDNVQIINSTTAKKLIASKKPVIIDARTIEEYETSHLKNSLRYDESVLTSLDKNEPILIYCTVGVRSNRLAKKLSEEGFNEVYDMKDGILGWANNEFVLVDKANDPTNQIHTYNKSFSPLLKKGNPVY